ncbi:MAG: hypothetical protein CM15mP49_22400 [Actinomycetota bacterium]|nr:MAG: hypothetical protein CM15mP49_22400 [Actinomycetota bacterium]
MYHYRWAYEADIEKAGQLLPLDQNLQLPEVCTPKLMISLLNDK